MANKKISELTAKGSNLEDDDLFIVSDYNGSTYDTKSITGLQIKNSVSASDATLTLTDITTNNVSTSKHGFVPKAPNDTSKYLRGDGSWAALSNGGIWGISNLSGIYTYYATLTLAMASAVSGDTIVQFSNVTESGAVTIALKNNVKINGNGYTYTFSNNTVNAFTIATSYTFDFINFFVNKTIDSSYSILASSGNCILNFNGGKFSATSNSGYLISDGNNGTIINGFNGLVTGNGTGIYMLNCYGAKAVNCNVKTTGSGTAYNYGAIGNYITHINCYGESTSNSGIIGGRVINSTGVSTSSSGISCYYADNCTGISTSSNGMYIAIEGINCTSVSTSGVGVAIGGTLSNSYVTSASGTCSQTIIADNCRFVAVANANFYDYSVKLRNCIVINQWNNASGSNFRPGNAPSYVFNSYLEVTNASAYNIAPLFGVNCKLANNCFSGATTPVINNTNQVTNIQDNQGNIVV